MEAGEARVDALKNVSFSMKRGEFGAVVGASGSGKSTLLNCIGGLDEANSGNVFLNGRNIFAMGEMNGQSSADRISGLFFSPFI